MEGMGSFMRQAIPNIEGLGVYLAPQPLITVLGVKYLHLRVEDGTDLYVTEYVLGLVWRFPPAGSVDSSKAELVLTTGASWIPNVHWGSGLGGWDPNVMYVMNRDNGSLFALEVGVPTKALPYPPTPDLTQER